MSELLMQNERLGKTAEDDETLSSELIYSEQEIMAEFQESCEEAGEALGQSTDRIKLAAKAFCRMLERKLHA